MKLFTFGDSWTEGVGGNIEDEYTTDIPEQKTIIRQKYCWPKHLSGIFESKTLYTLDFEPSDLFLVDVGDGIFSVMHNSCWCSWSYCGNWCYSYYCPTCNFFGPQKV